MSLEILISTMHQPPNDYSLLDNMNVQTDAVVVNQCDRCRQIMFWHGKNKITWIDTDDRGLSKSRNTALIYATADICLIADDDEILLDSYANIIEKAFAAHPDADLMRFKISGIEKPFKSYPGKPCKIGIRLSLKVSSVELAFKRDMIIRCGIKFDELIGAGTEFLMGEENAFIINCLRKGGYGWYEPVEIAHLHIGDSSWFTGFNARYYFARGASYAAISKYGSYFMSILFALAHKKDTDISLKKTIILMFRGIHKYKRKRKE